MANDTVITVVGNVTGDPEMRFSPSGDAVSNFSIASTPRTYNRQTNEWEDGQTLFLRCSIWREAAENVAETLTKGTRVIAQGRLKQRSYEKDGQQRTAYELEVDEVGPSLKYASAKVTRTQRNSNGGQQQGQQGGGQQSQQQDPWGAPQGGGQQGQQQGGQQRQQQSSQGWGNGPDSSEPPF